MARTYHLESRLFVARPLADTFAFFAEAGNLQRITPPFLHFEILTPEPIALHAGALIDYRIRIHGVPVRWRTEIVDWCPPNRFVDRQIRGPYREWTHTHTFRDVEGGTVVEDRVRYRPIGGALVHHLFVKRDLQRIFAYRQARILELLDVAAHGPAELTLTRA